MTKQSYFLWITYQTKENLKKTVLDQNNVIERK